MSGAPKGNKNGLKLKDGDVRQKAYQDYCDHLAKGKTKRSWYFEHKDLTCTWETFEKYIKDNVEFDPIKMKIAKSKGLSVWEQHVEDAALGVNEKANTASLQMAMRNKFGWDKDEKGTDSIDTSKLELISKFFGGIGKKKAQEEE